MMRRASRIALLVALAALAACAPAPRRVAPDAALLAAQATREARLTGHTRWALSGRVALASGRDGGQGRLDWSQDGEDFSIGLSAPVSRQSWRLIRRAGWARLEGLEGGPHEGPDAQALLWRETGWLIPVDALAAWARGLRAPGPAELEFDSDGLPALLRQSGWTVEYRDWDHSLEPPLPTRVFARRGEDRVRLRVETWDLAPPAASGPGAR